MNSAALAPRRCPALLPRRASAMAPARRQARKGNFVPNFLSFQPYLYIYIGKRAVIFGQKYLQYILGQISTLGGIFGRTLYSSSYDDSILIPWSLNPMWGIFLILQLTFWFDFNLLRLCFCAKLLIDCLINWFIMPSPHICVWFCWFHHFI